MRLIRFSVLVAFCMVALSLAPSRGAVDWVSPSVAFAQDRSNTYYAAQFPGSDKTAKITNAQAQCLSVPGNTCIIVIDAILGTWPQGAGTVPCTLCVWMDYSQGPSNIMQVVIGSGIVQYVITNDVTTLGGTAFVATGTFSALANFLPSTTGVAGLGTIAKRFSQLNIGDANGGVRWIGAGAYTGSRTLNVPDGNSGTVLAASLVTTAAASDNVAIQGMTAGGHCDIQPTNASAATNIATTFVSAKASNQITVSHAATANMNYDITCTSF